MTPAGEHGIVAALSTKGADVLATDYPFLDIMWTMFIFFAWVIWIWLLIMVLGDNFHRRDHSGLAKAGWTLFVIALPLLGVLIYMMARPAEEPPIGARPAT
jgi:hypothetical protein